MSPSVEEKIEPPASPHKLEDTMEVEDVSTEGLQNLSVADNEKKMMDSTDEDEKSDLITPSSVEKKRKKATAGKKESSHKNVKDEDYKLVKKKKLRVSEAVVKDAAQKMLSVLIKNYKDEIQEVPLDVLASSITSKNGKPYKNPRSDAIQMGMRLLKKQGKAEKGPGNVARLLQSEIDRIPREEISKDPAKVMEQRLHQFLDRLSSNPKGGAGEKIVEAAKQVWRKLSDGKAYSRKQLVAVTSYKATNSSGFEAIMKVLNELKFVDGKGQSSFTDKVFPYGRP
mmetsp:Transcript_9286/g.22539  ORF Transcript_9286/g.22539 Transcript_9286/m.22539 type:complete len:283 (-) Transcript_9286:95-943(-)